MAVVLIVEDEEPLRVLAESIIQEIGHQTLTAGTPEQALALLEGEQIDLLFTDLGLKDEAEAGLQLARAAVEQKQKLPVLYTTGHGITDGMRALFVANFGFLPKPYTMDDLKAALNNLLPSGEQP